MPKPNSRLSRITAAVGDNRVLAFVADQPLLASADASKVMASRKVQDHECRECGTRVTASVDTNPAPFCPCCGSSHTEVASTAYVKSHASHDRELSGLRCSSCKTVNLFHSKAIASVGSDGVHCVSCGTAMFSRATAAAPVKADLQPGPSMEGEMEKDPTPSTNGDVGTPVTKTELTPAERPPLDKTQPEVASAEDCGDNCLDGPGDGEEPEASVASWPYSTKADVFDDGVLDLDSVTFDPVLSPEDPADIGMDAVVTPPMEVPGDLSFEDNFGDYDGVPPNIPGMEGGFMDMSRHTVGSELRDMPQNEFQFAAIRNPVRGALMADVVRVDDSVEDLKFENLQGSLVAIKGHYTVAALTPKAAKHDAAVMFTEGFCKVVADHVKANGLRAGLVRAGFELFRVETATKETVRSAVAAEAERQTAALKAREEAMADSMAIAAVGMSRGFFKETPNPLLNGLSNELARMGVANHRAVASSLVAPHMLELSRVLAAKAAELAAQSEESRRALASALDLVSDDQLPADIQDVDGAPAVGESDFGVDPSLQVASANVDHRLAAGGVIAPSNDRPRQVAALLRPNHVSTLSPMAQAMLEGREPIFGHARF